MCLWFISVAQKSLLLISPLKSLSLSPSLYGLISIMPKHSFSVLVNILLKNIFNFPFMTVPIMCLRVFICVCKKAISRARYPICERRRVFAIVFLPGSVKYILFQRLICLVILSTILSRFKMFISDTVLTWKSKMVACVTGVYPIYLIICCDNLKLKRLFFQY